MYFILILLAGFTISHATSILPQCSSAANAVCATAYGLPAFGVVLGTQHCQCAQNDCPTLKSADALHDARVLQLSSSDLVAFCDTRNTSINICEGKGEVSAVYTSDDDGGEEHLAFKYCHCVDGEISKERVFNSKGKGSVRVRYCLNEAKQTLPICDSINFCTIRRQGQMIPQCQCPQGKYCQEVNLNEHLTNEEANLLRQFFDGEMSVCM